MSEHTKGPWKAEGPIIRAENGTHVAVVCAASQMLASLIEMEADAALIAAAPDLLEALEYVGKYRGEMPTHISDVCAIALKKAKP